MTAALLHADIDHGIPLSHFLFGLSNRFHVLHMISGRILKRARAREKSDTAHTYFYVHPWSP